MTQMVEKGNVPSDYFEAALENGELVMAPCCACGNRLDDDYFCEQCHRACRCRLVLCRDADTLDRVRQYIRKSSQFSGLTARLA
ncbi:hypothetical protein DSCW_42320 [Desulfosarcina widdelii]|uniref:Uncharacterized protein n=1 Tax=Desulfosarcina widdelii TaxID=947919 RepID=A0A5K7Z7Z1_9BACT|nr:hypothetical protein [Desulfosarcina widdelii]BBO76815.1 hypothetical protein DSCW_42320 [Desulfosarcina widdelii]